MTIDEAFQELIQSEEFKFVAKQRTNLGGAYRSYVSRYRRGVLGTGAQVELLINNGYVITANKVVKKSTRK